MTWSRGGRVCWRLGRENSGRRTDPYYRNYHVYLQHPYHLYESHHYFVFDNRGSRTVSCRESRFACLVSPIDAT